MSRLYLKTHAEVVKLGRLLGEPPERLSYLEKLRPQDLRAVAAVTALKAALSAHARRGGATVPVGR